MMFEPHKIRTLRLEDVGKSSAHLCIKINESSLFHLLKLESHKVVLQSSISSENPTDEPHTHLLFIVFWIIRMEVDRPLIQLIRVQIWPYFDSKYFFNFFLRRLSRRRPKSLIKFMSWSWSWCCSLRESWCRFTTRRWDQRSQSWNMRRHRRCQEEWSCIWPCNFRRRGRSRQVKTPWCCGPLVALLGCSHGWMWGPWQSGEDRRLSAGRRVRWCIIPFS